MTQSTQAAERSAGHAEPATPGRCHICAGPLRHGGAAVALVPGTNAEGRTVSVMACVCSEACAADPRWLNPWGALVRERDEAIARAIEWQSVAVYEAQRRTAETRERVDRGDDLLEARAKIAAAEARAARLEVAGSKLSFAAQTTGGTAGPDEGLQEAIRGWSAALAAPAGGETSDE